MAAVPWRLIVGDEAGCTDRLPVAGAGAHNMAFDQALLESVAVGAPPVLRLYRWRPACLSFGRNQPAAGLYDETRVRALGLDVVRRPTGGFGVLHDAELTYAVVAPAGLLGGPRAAYAAINRALAQGLRTLGVPASLAAGTGGRPDAPAFPAVHPCFEQAAAGEVVVAGRKLVGSAQRVERRTILQHGSILLDGTQAALQQLRTMPATGADARIAATSVREVLGRVPSWDALTRALVDAVANMVGTALAPAALGREERARVQTLEGWFADPAWTWRR